MSGKNKRTNLSRSAKKVPTIIEKSDESDELIQDASQPAQQVITDIRESLNQVIAEKKEKEAMLYDKLSQYAGQEDLDENFQPKVQKLSQSQNPPQQVQSALAPPTFAQGHNSVNENIFQFPNDNENFPCHKFSIISNQVKLNDSDSDY